MNSVKVMRSYDYCHFEVCLGSDQAMTIDEVNDLRKQAAILVDEAVREYKIAKRKEQDRENNQYKRDTAIERMKHIKAKPESEWSPEDAAMARVYESDKFWKEFEEDDWYYQYDAEREYHFSMLRRFKESKVKAG